MPQVDTSTESVEMSKNIQEKIEALYKITPTLDETTPQWAKALLLELEEIKGLVNNTKNRAYPTKNRGYFRFVCDLRKKLRADTELAIYPEVVYEGKRIGANFNGLLYNKKSSRILPRREAFRVYDYFYEKRENIDAFIIRN